jgi:hypothetical protein
MELGGVIILIVTEVFTFTVKKDCVLLRIHKVNTSGNLVVN